MPTRLIASSIALIAFAAAVLAGVVADNAASTIMLRAIVAMIGCYFAGLLIAHVGHCAVAEHIEQYKQAHPIEDAVMEDETNGASDALSDHDDPEQTVARTTMSASQEAA